MTDKLKALERQIEILTIFYPTQKVSVYSISNLAEKYKIDEQTIKKDLKALRSIGLPIKQVESGVIITGNVDPNVLSSLLIKYIYTYHTEVIVSTAFYQLTDGDKMYPINHLREIVTAIETQVLIKMRYKVDLRNVIELTVLPVEIITNKSELGFIGIHNNTVCIYNFMKIISIEGTAEYNSNNYDLLVNEFYKKHLYPSSKIKVKITIEMKFGIEDYWINEVATSKIENCRIEEEIKHYSLRNYAYSRNRYSEIENFYEFAHWVIEQYHDIKVIDLKIAREAIHQIINNPYFQRFNKSSPMTNVIRDDETTYKSTASSLTPINITTPKKDFGNEVIKSEIPKNRSLNLDGSNKNLDIPSIVRRQPLTSITPTYDIIEVELSIKDLYDYSEIKPSLVKRIINKWIYQNE